MTPNDVDFLKLLTDIIQKYIVILGPSVVLTKVRSLGNITLDDKGIIKSLEGDRKEYFAKLIPVLSELSPATLKKTVEPLLASNPELLAILSQSGVQVEEKKQPSEPSQPQNPPQ